MPAPSWPLTMPTNKGFTDIKWDLRRNNALVHNPWTFDNQSQRFDGAQWVGSLTLPNMNRDTYMQWNSFFRSLEGTAGTFYLPAPNNENSLTADGVLQAAYTPGTYDIVVRVPTSTTGTPYPGQYIQIGDASAARLYEIRTATPIASNGDINISLTPKMRHTFGAGTIVKFRNPVGVFRLMENIDVRDVNRRHIYKIPTFAVQEVI